MPTVYLSPIGNSQQVDSSGVPRNLAKLYTYAAGSTTPRTTYTDSTGNTAQANPIILNSLGLPDNPIWLPTGQTKFVLKTPADVTIWTEDNVTGINDVSLSVSEWQASGLTPTYISATSFSFSGDQTPNCLVGRRLQSTNTAGTVYSRITAASYGAGITTVTVASDSGTLDSGLSAVSYGLLTPTNPSYPVFIDSVAKFMDDSDKSKLMAFQLSSITTATTRTLTVPDASGTIALAGNAQSTLGSVAGTNTITAALTPVALAAYVSGQKFTFVPANTNTGATTINIDSLGAKNLFIGGAACVGGEIRQSVPVTVEYDGTQFNILGPYVGGNLPTGQIKFPATQNASSDANTLDDYEEGTYTPSNVNMTTGSGTNTGTYRKVGSQVTVWSNFTFGVGSSFGGVVQLGLPFASVSALNGLPTGVWEATDSGTGYFFGPISQNNTGAMIFDRGDGTSNQVNATIPMTWTTNDALRTCFTYTASA